MQAYDYSKTINQIDEKFEGHEFLAVADIADYLEVTPRTVLNIIQRGQLPAFKVGREYRIPKDGFKGLLKE